MLAIKKCYCLFYYEEQILMSKKTTRSLSIAHLNVRSLLTNFDNLSLLILAGSYDIIRITETWLSEIACSDTLSIPGYRFFRQDRGSRGGGVAFYISPIVPRKMPPSREVCFCKIEWMNELDFLSLFENGPVIWNPRIPDHKNSNKVADAWTNIQKQFSVECSVAELKKTKKSLMAMFRQLLNKVKSSLKSGAVRADIFKPSWFAYEIRANFLQPVHSARDTTNTEIEMNTYMHVCGKKGITLNLQQDELQAFFGMLLIMGFHTLSSLRLYWSTDQNFHVSRISSIMSQKRFLHILRYLHLNDNDVMPQRGNDRFDRLYKVRPPVDILNERFSSLYAPYRELFIDESMVAFKGRTTLKPIRHV
nr:unnamed protein product [Callosobruchus analis]